MEEIKNLIDSSELELEKNSQRTIMVGNRPHYPMLLLFNEAFDGDAYRSMCAKLGRIWPQSMQHLVKCGYSLANGKIKFVNYENGEDETEESLLTAVDEEQREYNTFVSMMQLLIYNVVDTSSFGSVEDFEEHYQLIEHIKNLVGGNSMTMLIVLLNDSNRRRKVADEIREYLSKNNGYDSVVLISTRTRNNIAFAVSDLYRIVANVLVLSNNDATISADDADFQGRFALLYNQSIYTLSYVLCEKPNHKIAIQINDIVLDHALDYLKNAQVNDLSSWSKKLGIENGKSRICEDFISSLNISIDPGALNHIPVRECVVNKKIDLLNCSYKKFCEYSYTDVITYFADSYCRTYVMDNLDVRLCAGEFEKWIRDTVSPAELVELDDITLDRIIGLIDMGALNEDLSLRDYIIRQIQIHVRKKHIYPQFRAVIQRLRANSEKVIKTIENVQAEYKKYIPLNCDDLGTIYTNLTDNYFGSKEGNDSLGAICNPGNDIEDIFRAMQQCFAEILKTNKAVFSVPFIEEWAKRLDLTGDRIYREISLTLNQNADEMIRLYGNFPVEKKLTVYMLHTVDVNGNHPTTLFEHLKETFKGDNDVQYFNTGYDDALESISLIPCNGINLLI